VDPLLADRIRKVVAVLVAALATVLLLRVLARAADGTFSLGDPALWGVLVLATVSVLWVRSASRPPR
jgi:hypothetical protein